LEKKPHKGESGLLNSSTITDQFRGIYRTYLQYYIGKLKDVNMQPVGLANSRISAFNSHKSPDHWLTSSPLPTKSAPLPFHPPTLWQNFASAEFCHSVGGWRGRGADFVGHMG